jgi:hypothetical protein
MQSRYKAVNLEVLADAVIDEVPTTALPRVGRSRQRVLLRAAEKDGFDAVITANQASNPQPQATSLD